MYTSLVLLSSCADARRARQCRHREKPVRRYLSFAPFGRGVLEDGTRMSAMSGPQLTRREKEVAALVAVGLTNREIAERLVISERTAEGHVEQIRNKLGLRARAQVAVWAAEQGLLARENQPSSLDRGTRSTTAGSPQAAPLVLDAPLFSPARLPGQIVCPNLVGREADLEQIAAHIDAAAVG